MAEDKSKYTKPDLRERIKNRVMREGRGGNQGNGRSCELNNFGT